MANKTEDEEIPGKPDKEDKEEREPRQRKRSGESKEEMTPAIIKLLTRRCKGTVKKDKVVGMEKEKREASSHSGSTWRGTRPVPSRGGDAEEVCGHQEERESGMSLS